MAFVAPANRTETDAWHNRTGLLMRLASAQTVLPPRIEEVNVRTADPTGTVVTTPVMRLDFPEQVFFDFDREVLWPDAGPVCDLIADSLRRDVAGVQVTIVGHTDAIGSDSYNLDLSRRRALAVMQALVARGVDPAALSTVAVGKRQPAASDDTPAGRAENRRVEFLVSPSLQANLAVVERRPIQGADLAADAANAAVPVLRPASAADGTLSLAAIGSIGLATPEGALTSPLPKLAPAVTVDQAEGPPLTQPALPAPKPVPLIEAPPAVARSLAPQYAPRVPGAALSY